MRGEGEEGVTREGLGEYIQRKGDERGGGKETSTTTHHRVVVWPGALGPGDVH